MPVLDDPRWDPQMRLVLEMVEAGGAEARTRALGQPFARLRAELDAAGMFANEGGPAMAATEEVWAPVQGRSMRCRIYRPRSMAGAAPALVFLHGGGWALSSIETHDRLAREIASRSGVAVISVDYALSPEAVFPQALEECAELVSWLARHGEDWGVNPDRLAIGGDSAGGNLAFGTAMFLRDRRERILRALLALYPVCDCDLTTESYEEFADGCFLTREMMRSFWSGYVPRLALRFHPYASPLRGHLHGLPPSLLVLAELDVLRSEGEEMSRRLAQAGCEVTCKTFSGMAHGFMRHAGRIGVARDALAKSGAWLMARMERDV